MDGIQVLGASKIDAGQNIAASMMNNSSTVGNPRSKQALGDLLSQNEQHPRIIAATESTTNKVGHTNAYSSPRLYEGRRCF
jgi:hypothetical protein